MGAKVLRLYDDETYPARLMPERFHPKEMRRLLEWASRKNFTLEEVRFAVRSVRDWAETRPRAPLRRDWVRVIQVSMRQGWSLRGCRAELERTSTRRNPRDGRPVIKRTPLTDAVISGVLQRLAAKAGEA